VRHRLGKAAAPLPATTAEEAAMPTPDPQASPPGATAPDPAAHANPAVTLRDHLMAHLTVGSRDDLVLHMGGPMAGHAGDLAELDAAECDALRRRHVEDHGITWQQAMNWLAAYRARRSCPAGDGPAGRAA
jgi:hypothetical protein